MPLVVSCGISLPRVPMRGQEEWYGTGEMIQGESLTPVRTSAVWQRVARQ